MCEQVQGDEAEVRAIRLDRLGLDLSDEARAYVCNLPVFDELADAIRNTRIEYGAGEYVEGMKSVWAHLGAAIEQPRQAVQFVESRATV